MEKVALLTGCGGSVSVAMAEALLARGWRVVVAARRLTPLARLAQGGADCLTCDVTDPESVDAVFFHIQSRYGRLDLCLNHAGPEAIGPLSEVPIAALDAEFSAGVVGLLRVVQGAVPLLCRSPRPVLANVSGPGVSPFRGAPSASGAAIRVCDEALRMELAPFGVRVVSVLPGLTTKATPLQHQDTIDGLSLYRPWLPHIRQRLWEIGSRVVSAEQLAARVIPRLVGCRPPAIIRCGPRPTAAAFFRRLLPSGLRRWLLMRRSGLLPATAGSAQWPPVQSTR